MHVQLVEVVINTKFSRQISSSTEKLKALNETVKALSQTMTQSNAALSAQVQAMSQRLTTLDKQGTYSEAFLTDPPSHSYLSRVF